MPTITAAVVTTLATAAEKLAGLSQKLDELATNRLLREHVLPVREDILRVKELVFEAKQAQAAEVAKLQQEYSESEAALVAENKKLVAKNEELIATIHRLQSPNQNATLESGQLHDDLSSEQESLLVAMTTQEQMTSTIASGILAIGTEAAKFHLYKLLERNFVTYTYGQDRGDRWTINQHGREYLHNHGLLT